MIANALDLDVWGLSVVNAIPMVVGLVVLVIGVALIVAGFFAGHEPDGQV